MARSGPSEAPQVCFERKADFVDIEVKNQIKKYFLV
jgi:hypothetical protein